MFQMQPGQKRCSRSPDCVNPAELENGWCKPCRAKYQREYNATRDEMAFKRGFAAGVEAQRQDFIDQWLWFPADYMVPCAEVAKAISERARPVYTPKVIEMASEPVAKT